MHVLIFDTVQYWGLGGLLIGRLGPDTPAQVGAPLL